MPESKKDDGLRDDVDRIKADLGSLKSDLTDLTKALVDFGKDTVRGAKDEAQGKVEQLRGAVERLRARGSDIMDDVEERVTANPTVSLLAAFGLGFILGKVLDRS
jgi:ElaB/YqjD/DUF883 family membrane-anchored ribosome-binding protein